MRPPTRVWMLWCHTCSGWLDECSTKHGAWMVLNEHPLCRDGKHDLQVIRFDRVSPIVVRSQKSARRESALTKGKSDE